MNEARLRTLLRDAPLAAERPAEDRSWQVVKAAYRHRAPSTPARRPRLALVLAAAGAVLALVALTPAGARVRDWIDDVINPGAEHAPPLTSLPSGGRLLVESEAGPWVVQPDGSRRLLGAYGNAAWSPNGIYVAATRGSTLTAVVADPLAAGQPAGTARWSLSASAPVAGPAWAPSGLRVAYLAGHALRTVAGDGEGDRLLDHRVAPTQPDWRPDVDQNVLAYVDAGRRVTVVDAETNQVLWRSGAFGTPVRALDWSADGSELLVLTPTFYVVLAEGGSPVVKGTTSGGALAGAFAPTGSDVALVRHDITGRSELALVTRGPGGEERHLLSRRGRFTGLAWSPDGEWIVVAWRDADQWLFVRPHDRKVIAVGNVSEQFAPGANAPVRFPRLAGWCCSPPPSG
jgi:dipeptidyl aminopeptidase/acylaminoacyl peptidase